MRDDPGLDGGRIAGCLNANYGLAAAGMSYLPVGHDMNAFVYRVEASDGNAYLLKIRRGPVNERALAVPRALLERGIPNILGPLPARTGELWCALDEAGAFTVVLYPFIEGMDAKVAGMTIPQWRVFGETLQAVHGSGLEADFRDRLRTERFALPSAALVERITTLATAGDHHAAVASAFAGFWRANRGKIDQTLARAKAIGRGLQAKPFDLVLCHSDIHAANILVTPSGDIYLIDWDDPMVAPRERDLLFVAGGRIARRVEPHEEDAFFAGYGPVEIDPDALIYYRYERIVEDLGEFGKSVLLDPHLSAAARQMEADLARSLVVPGGDIDRAETLPRLRFPVA